MAKPERPRYIPSRTRSGSIAPPSWFLRKAVSTFGLSPFATTAMHIVADNLDAQGASRTAVNQISQRGNMSPASARKAVADLLDAGMIFELDARQPGRMMRYAIPPQMPWHPDH